MLRVCALVLLACAACACSSARAARELEPGGAAPLPPAARTACDLLMTTKLVAKGRLQYTLQAQIENVSKQSLSFVLMDRCPAGLLAFEGLPDDYDYYQTCNAGACVGASGAQTIQLAAGQRKLLASVALSVEGGTCNAPLEQALYRLRPRVPDVTYNVCVEGVLLDLRNVRIPSKPVAVAPKPSEPKPSPPATAADPRACTRSDECVLSCPSVPGCCGWSCGCKNAIRHDQVASFARSYAKTCPRAPQCPAMACSYEPAYAAACRNGRCVAAEHGLAF
jgi:hypothetical protein